MGGYTETGYLKLDLNVTVIGALPKGRAKEIESELFEFFKERRLNIEGKISYVKIDTLDVEHNYQNLDTSSK